MIAPPKLPSHDELEALIKETRERQLRRRLLGAAAVAIAAAVGLSVFGLALRPTGPTARHSTGDVGGPPLCRASQLSASSYWNGAAGTLINFFTIANRSGGSCSLPLRGPAVVLLWHGSVLDVEQSTPNDKFGFAPHARPLRILEPGGKAAVYMQWSNWCGWPRSGLTTSVALRFHDGLLVTATNVRGQPPCLNRAEPSVLVVSRVLTPS
jgi:hypothetical protein